jgi:hypothetical protein
MDNRKLESGHSTRDRGLPEVPLRFRAISRRRQVRRMRRSSTLWRWRYAAMSSLGRQALDLPVAGGDDGVGASRRGDADAGQPRCATANAFIVTSPLGTSKLVYARWRGGVYQADELRGEASLAGGRGESAAA